MGLPAQEPIRNTPCTMAKLFFLYLSMLLATASAFGSLTAQPTLSRASSRVVAPLMVARKPARKVARKPFRKTARKGGRASFSAASGVAGGPERGVLLKGNAERTAFGSAASQVWTQYLIITIFLTIAGCGKQLPLQ